MQRSVTLLLICLVAVSAISFGKKRAKRRPNDLYYTGTSYYSKPADGGEAKLSPDYYDARAPSSSLYDVSSEPAGDLPPGTLSEARAVVDLMRRRWGTKVFSRGLFPDDVQAKIKAANATIYAIDAGERSFSGKDSDAKDGLPLNYFATLNADNKPILEVVFNYLSSLSTTTLGAGQFGTAVLLPLKGEALVSKRLKPLTKSYQIAQNEKLNKALRKDSILEKIRHIAAISIHTEDATKADDYLRGYVMKAATVSPQTYIWLQQWVKFALYGALHLDLKPDNLAPTSAPMKNRELIDMDNIICQLYNIEEAKAANKKLVYNGLIDDGVASDQRYYGINDGNFAAYPFDKEIDNVFKLADATGGFLLVPDGKRIFYIIGKVKLNPKTVAPLVGCRDTSISAPPLIEYPAALGCTYKVVCAADHTLPALTADAEDLVKFSNNLWTKNLKILQPPVPKALQKNAVEEGVYTSLYEN